MPENSPPPPGETVFKFEIECRINLGEGPQSELAEAILAGLGRWLTGQLPCEPRQPCPKPITEG